MKKILSILFCIVVIFICSGCVADPIPGDIEIIDSTTEIDLSGDLQFLCPEDQSFINLHVYSISNGESNIPIFVFPDFDFLLRTIFFIIGFICILKAGGALICHL